jgi:hypothetical protein
MQLARPSAGRLGCLTATPHHLTQQPESFAVHRPSLWKLGLIGAWLWLSAQPLPAGEVMAVVVRPPNWSPAVQDWRAHRAAQGLLTVELDSQPDPMILRSELIALASQHPTIRYVLLAADAPALDQSAIELPERIPTFYLPAEIVSQFGSPNHIASDLPYGDLNGDGSPQLAVGRIPAQTSQQLAEMLARVIAYERLPPAESWRERIELVAGIGGFGLLLDRAVEQVARNLISDGIPDHYRLQLTHASCTSPYCPDPTRLASTVIDQLNQGSLLWIYIGHGQVTELDSLRLGEQLFDILGQPQLEQIDIPQGPPIALFLACFTGAFDAPVDCLAEQLVRLPAGPIAALAGSRVTMPYGLSSLAAEMLEACFVQRHSRLGDILLTAQQRVIEPVDTASLRPAATSRGWIDGLATWLSPSGHDLQTERREHAWLINLLGDPMLRIDHPEPIELHLPRQATIGQPLMVTGNSPVAGRLRVELVHRPDDLPSGVVRPRAGQAALAEQRAELQRNYQQANHRQLLEVESDVPAGPFAVALPLEVPRLGSYVIRAEVSSAGHRAAGSGRLLVRPPTPAKLQASPPQP